MKKLNLLGIFALFSIALIACSEGNNVPNQQPASPYAQGYPQGQFNGNQTGLNQGGYNPYLQPQNGNYNQWSAQAQGNLQLRANLLFNCQYRRGLYYSNTISNNCALRRQPTYTPTSCACYHAPCNCVQEIERARSRCRYVSRSTLDNGDRDEVVTHTSDKTEVSNPSSLSDDQSTKTSTLSLLNEDAKALYERMAIETMEKKAPHNGQSSFVRRGMNWECMMTPQADKKPNLYACDIELTKTDGKAMELSHVGKLSQAEVASNLAYSGPSLTINDKGEASFIITGITAAKIYKALDSKVNTGTLITDDKAPATLKTGTNVKCASATIAQGTVVQCVTTLKTDTGSSIDLK